jgi:hypothetical protein
MPPNLGAEVERWFGTVHHLSRHTQHNSAMAALQEIGEYRKRLRIMLKEGLPSADVLWLTLDAAEGWIDSEMNYFLSNDVLGFNTLDEGNQTRPTLANLYIAYFSVMDLVQRGSQERPPTISQLADGLMEVDDLRCFRTSVMRQRIVVAVLGWATFMFTYQGGDISEHRIAVQSVDRNYLSMHLMQAGNRKPGDLLRAYDLLDVLSDEDVRQDRLLYLAILNYWSLKNIGNLRIMWVPHISQHLKLDLTTRTLCLFQYPTYCALQCLGGASGHRTSL